MRGAAFETGVAQSVWSIPVIDLFDLKLSVNLFIRCGELFDERRGDQ
jgi:hypothetical protein